MYYMHSDVFSLFIINLTFETVLMPTIAHKKADFTLQIKDYDIQATEHIKQFNTARYNHCNNACEKFIKEIKIVHSYRNINCKNKDFLLLI